MAYQYLAQPNVYQPGYAPAPFNLSGANPPGSDFATAMSYATTSLLHEEIYRTIFDEAPAKYNALKLLNSFGVEDVKSDEYKWFYAPWQRPTITVHLWNDGTGVLTLAGTYTNIQDLPAVAGDVIVNYSDVPFLVTAVSHSAVVNSSTITIRKQYGGVLAAGDFNAGETVAIQGPVVTDGTDFFDHYDRAYTLSRYNYIEFIQRNCRWGVLEQAKYEELGNTDYMDIDKMLKIEQLRVDMISKMFNGTRGLFQRPDPNTVSGGTIDMKQTGGIYYQMVQAGSQHATATLGSLQTIFENLVLATDRKAEGAVRYIFGTNKLLYNLSKSFKEDGIRYQPNDRVADLNLYEYKVGSCRIVPVETALFGENTVFPPAWKNRMLCLDSESIRLNKFSRFPQFMMGQIDGHMTGGNNEKKYTEWWVMAQLGVKVNNPLACFYIDMI